MPRLVPQIAARDPTASAIIVGGMVVATALMLGALALWAYYGSAVFFEMIASGIAACF